MKNKIFKPAKGVGAGPSQRQLRAGELIRHALVDILREEVLQDPALVNISVTVTQVRMSPDLRHAICFVEPLGAGLMDLQTREPSSPSRTAVVPGSPAEVVAGLNRVTKFLRGRLGQGLGMRFTPDLKFIHDDSFDNAKRMDILFDNPKIQADLRVVDETPDADAGKD
ncbi:30S ribosome-binding factor RbfA [soil metagenome]